MKVVYLTTYDSGDITQWSGTGYFIAESLKMHGVELERLNCAVPFTLYQKLIRKIYRVFLGKSLQLEREKQYLQKIAQEAEKLLSQMDYDILLSPGSLPVSYLKIDKPIVIFTDATYDCLMELYMKGNKLADRSLLQGNNAESSALKNASLIFYTSEWAKESAVHKYQTDKQKLRFSYLGANLDQSLTIEEIHEVISHRVISNVIKLLFIGVEWERKGAAAAIETARQLNDRGIRTELTLVGCKVPDNVSLPVFVIHVPFVSKATPEGKMYLHKLFTEANYFILPTIADCSPVVFSEAASYALPVMTTNTGGCGSIIKHNQTGFCYYPEEYVERAVQEISALTYDPDMYKNISLNAYQMFQDELNWKVVGQKTLRSLESLLQDN